MAKSDYLKSLMRDLESHTEVRRFGSGWLSGFFGLLFAISGFFMVVALRFPDWFATPELEIVKGWTGFRGIVHLTLLASYGLSLLSLLLRPRKVLGLTALMIGLAAALMGGANVQPAETRDWGIFFGLDFFVVNLLVTGFMFAPLERAFPHRRAQRLFRTEWREDLFYYLVSTMFVQILGFLALAPQAFVNDHTSSWAAFRAGVAALPWIAQFVIVLFVSDLGLALMTKVAPQLNALNVMFPAKIGMTLVLVGLSFPVLTTVVERVVDHAMRAMAALMGG